MSELYSVSTPHSVVPAKAKQAKELLSFIMNLDGFFGVHAANDAGILWFFNTKNDAIRGRNLMEFRGVRCGCNICRFVEQSDGTLVYADE